MSTVTIDIDAAREIYQKIHNGDSITDLELNAGIKAFRAIAYFLKASPHLFLAWKEIDYDLLKLESFKCSRDEA